MSATPADEPTQPFPPPYWWLKRLLVLAIALTVGFVFTMRWWAHEAKRRGDAEIAAIHAAGEPLLADEFPVVAVPDELNAAVCLKAAEASMPAIDQKPLASFDPRSEMDAPTRTAVQTLADNSARARELLREARFRPQFNWGIRIDENLPRLLKQRLLSQLLERVAILEHTEGHDAEALEIVRDMLAHAERLDQISPLRLPNLMSAVCTGFACQTVEGISINLAVAASADSATQPTGPASRQQVKLLIAELLNDQAFHDSYARSWIAERARTFATFREAGLELGSSRNSTFGLPILNPMFELDGLGVLKLYREMAIASRALSYYECKSQVETLQRRLFAHLGGTTRATEIAHTIAWITEPEMSDSVRSHFKALAARRVAALRLAIRLYQIDHAGAFPEKLEDLSPNYIPSLPSDPFAPVGQTFNYRREPAVVLYSVGPTGRNSGADEDVTFPWLTPPPPKKLLRRAN
jgi:hypothetical protein